MKWGKSNESVGYQTIRQQSVRPDELGGVDEPLICCKKRHFAKVLAPKWHLSITVQVGVLRTTISKQSWQDKNSGILCSLEFFFEREVKLAEEGL